MLKLPKKIFFKKSLRVSKNAEFHADFRSVKNAQIFTVKSHFPKSDQKLSF